MVNEVTRRGRRPIHARGILPSGIRGGYHTACHRKGSHCITKPDEFVTCKKCAKVLIRRATARDSYSDPGWR